MAWGEDGGRHDNVEEEVDLHTIAGSQRRIEASLTDLVVGQETIAAAISKARQDLQLLTGGRFASTTADALRHEPPTEAHHNSRRHSSTRPLSQAGGGSRRRRTTFAVGRPEPEEEGEDQHHPFRAVSVASSGRAVSVAGSEARRSSMLRADPDHQSQAERSWMEARRSRVSTLNVRASARTSLGYEAVRSSMQGVESMSSGMTAQEVALSMTIRHLNAERFDDNDGPYDPLTRSFSATSGSDMSVGELIRQDTKNHEIGEDGFVAPTLPLFWPCILSASNEFNDSEQQEMRMARVGKGATGFKDQDDEPSSRLLLDTSQSTTACCGRGCSFLIDPSSVKFAVWQLCSVLLLMYDLLVIPYVLAWDLTFKGFLEVMMWISSFFWLIDVPMNFVTCYYNKKGELETNRRNIALRYLRTWFFMDLLLVVTDWSSLILSMSEGSDSEASGNLRLMRLAKAGRVLRIAGVLRLLRFMRVIEDRLHMSIGETQRLALTVGAISLGVLWFNHVTSCIWYAIGMYAPSDTDRRWVQHHLAVDPTTGDSLPYLETGPWYQYLTAFHWSVAQMTLGAIEVPSTNVVERFFSIVCLTFGLLLGSTLISTLSAAMVDFRDSHRERNDKLRDLRRYLRENKVTKRLAIAVQQQATERMGTRAKLHDTDVSALRLLSTVVRSQLRYDILGPLISKMPILRLIASLDEDIAQQLCTRGVDMLFLQPKDHLFVGGNVAEGVFYLSNGTLSYTQDPHFAPVAAKLTRVVTSNRWLAEAAFWSEWIHVGTAEADLHCQAIAIRIGIFTEQVGRHLVIRQICKEYCEEFHRRLTEAIPPHSQWPDDLEVPASDYADLVVAMGKEVQVIIGLDAVKLLSPSITTRRCIVELKEEIRKGKSVVVVSGDGEVRRIVATIILKISNQDGHILVKLGSRQAGAPLRTHVQLPGTKRRRGEVMQTSVQRLLRKHLRSLSHCVSDIEGTTREVLEMESIAHHIPTKYMRTCVSMRLERPAPMPAVSSRLTYQRRFTSECSRKHRSTLTSVATLDLGGIRSPGSKSFPEHELGRFQAAYGISSVVFEDGRRDYYTWVSPSDQDVLFASYGEALAQAWLMDMVEEGVECCRMSLHEAAPEYPPESDGASSDSSGLNGGLESAERDFSDDVFVDGGDGMLAPLEEGEEDPEPQREQEHEEDDGVAQSKNLHWINKHSVRL